MSNPERTRRAVHFAAGFCALLVKPLGADVCAAIAGAAVLYNVALAPALRLDRAYRRPGEGLWGGLTTYPLAVLLLLLLTPPAVAAGAWAVLAVADPVAAEVGTLRPRPAFPGNPRKSLAGSAAGWLAGTIACQAVLVYMDVGLHAALPAAATAAAAGAVAEALPLPGEDNLRLAAASALALLPWLG